jgi:hypothetical protein
VKPSTRMKRTIRVALRRRKGFAALRVLRRGLLAAMLQHRRLTVGEAPYAGDVERVAVENSFRRGVRRLLARWPHLNFTDARADP